MRTIPHPPPEDVDNELLTVGEVATMFGVRSTTVRTWDTKGTLIAAGRTPGGHRRYRWADVAPILGADPDNAADHLLPSRLSFARHHSAGELEKLYVHYRLSTYAIAVMLGVHQRTVWKAVRDAGINRRPRGGWHARRAARAVGGGIGEQGNAA